MNTKIKKILKKKNRSKIVCLTAYSKKIASILDRYCDLILVGDSLGSVLYNYKSTKEVTLDIMINHSKSVRLGVQKSIMIVDMPYNTYQTPKQALKNVKLVMKKTKCDGVKLEGGKKIIPIIKNLVKHKIPVMGHVGILPQSDKKFTYKGKKQKESERILNETKLLEKTGVFSIVLECIEKKLSKQITEKIKIPTIGIGSSANCDGQVLVIDDLIGMSESKFKFVKKYVDINELVILKSSLSSEQRKEVLNKIASGSVKFIVGTHSLFQDRVVYENLGLIVIDEQHRFGVLQRKLMAEKGRSPDILIMTATPIPRTLSSIFFSDYSISRINMMPENRGKIETKISSLRSSDNAFDFAVNQLKEGRQAFVLCPLISKSENIEFESLADVESVYKDVAFNSFKDFKVEILHGKQKSSDKEKIMDKFRKKEIDVLVSTTVIEVGVDIPNANLMIIYNPERFGLSQLHQLRGRIGRGGYDSTCILMVDDINESSKERLSIFRDNLDGFVLSEKDMQIRGPGAFYGAGTEQSGRFWDLHLANLRRDFEILKEAKKCADNIESYKFYNDRMSILENLILDFWGDKLELTKTI